MVILGGVSKDYIKVLCPSRGHHADPPGLLADGVQVKLHGCFAY